MSSVDPEVLLSAGYAIALLAVGLGLDSLARATHNRAKAYRTAGFTYHPDHDHWVCPEGEHLWPHEYDQEQRLVRYRAKARVCNGCPVKERCTDSDRGREIVRTLDSWPRSEAGRFHRGIALVPVTLAALILLVTAIRHPVAEDLAAVALVTGLTGLTAWRLTGDFRATPANFPAPSPSQGLHLRRNSRTRWGWDR